MVRFLCSTITRGYVGIPKSHPDIPNISKFGEHLSTKYYVIVGNQFNRQSSFIEYSLQLLDDAGSPDIATASKWQINWDHNLLLLDNASPQNGSCPFQPYSNSYTHPAYPSSSAWELDLWIDTWHCFWLFLRLLLRDPMADHPYKVQLTLCARVSTNSMDVLYKSILEPIRRCWTHWFYGFCCFLDFISPSLRYSGKLINSVLMGFNKLYIWQCFGVHSRLSG